MAAKREDKQVSTESIIKKLDYLRPALITWGLPSTIKRWNELENFSSDDIQSNFRNAERFFRAIRKKAGCDDSELEPGGLLSILIRKEDKQMALDTCKGEIYD